MGKTGKSILKVILFLCCIFGSTLYSSCSNKKVERDKNGKILKNGQFYDSLEEKTGKVWICTGKSSHAYHSTDECYGIKSCRSKKKIITLEEAKAMGRTPCHYCHKEKNEKKLSRSSLYYVCTDFDNDGYYHSTPACEILDECNNEVEEVTFADVEMEDRDPCPECVE